MDTNRTENISLDSAHVAASGVDLQVSNHFKLDRYLGDTMVLPYIFNEIKLKSNELCVADNINACIYKLHYNYLYLNAQTKIAANDFPRQYQGFIASDKNTGNSDVLWYSSSTSTTSLSHHLSATNGTALSGLVAGAFVKSIESRIKYVGFVCNVDTLMAVESDDGGTTSYLKLNKKTIEDSTALKFTDLRDLAINSEKRLFVIDGNNIHKFDVDAVLTDNPAISAVGRFLLKSIGGKSTNIYDKDKFNKPVGISIGKNNKTYILDQADLGFKVYDKDLNWIYTAGRSPDFNTSYTTGLSGGVVVDIVVDKNTEHFYVLSDNGIILEFDDKYDFVKKSKLEDAIATGEKFKKIELSNKDDNIIYVLTDKSLFKKFRTKLDKSIGAFRLTDKGIHTEESLGFVSVMDNPDLTYDYVFVGSDIVFDNVDDEPHKTDEGYTGVHSSVGKIFKFDEKINHRTIVYDQYKTDVFDLSAINTRTDEYVTSWVLNKALHKLLYNHLLFRDNIHLKYKGAYDNVGRLQYSGVRYIKDLDQNLFTYNTNLNNFIGLNEPVLAETVNRCLNEVYTMQNIILEMCKEDVTNVFPYPSHVVGLA